MSFFKKFFLIFAIIFISFSFIFLSKVDSQTDNNLENPIARNGYSLMCLDASTSDAEWFEGWCACGESEKGQCKEGCVPDTGQVKGDGRCIKRCPLSKPPENGVANFTLKNPTGNKLPPNHQFYVVIPLGNGFTTTIDELDDQLGLLKSNNLKLTYPSNPSGIFLSDANGDIEVEGVMKGSLVGHKDYLFYALYNPSITQNNNQEIDVGEERSLQLGSFSFFQFENSENSIKKCTSIYWDPYGRVFDSISLEPISNIQIRILTEIYPNEKLATVIGKNPVFTKEDGVFNFLTEPGYYYLRLSNIPFTHSFKDTPNLNPLYKEIYGKNYNAKKSIYKPDEVIAEIIDTPEEKKRGYPFPEERDIPLDPGNNKPYVAPIIHMDIVQVLDSIDGGYVIFKGKASHPYPIVVLKDNKEKVIYKKEFYDEKARYGFWSLEFKKEVVPTDTSIKIELQKNKKYFKYDNDIKISNVKIFEPILSYIEGYTKDSFGKIIPNALVKIRLLMNNRIYYQTYSDNNGYFKITSDKLPPFSYYLEINGQRMTTSDFVRLNQDYINKNKIKLMSNIYSEEFINKEKENKNKIDNLNNFNIFNNKENDKINLNQNQNYKINNKNQIRLILYIVIIFLFLILIASIILAYFFFVKKNRV